MKLTPLGRDYLVAALLLDGLGFVSGYSILMGLSFALTLASVASLALLRWRSGGGNASTDRPSVRLFKRDSVEVAIRLSGQGRWSKEVVESVSVEGPVDAQISATGGELRLRLTPSRAGRFRGLALTTRFQDALGLFTTREKVGRPDFTIDSLPVSLLERPRVPGTPYIVVGENPAGAPGTGQEFFGIAEYSGNSESKDILWKRAAKDPHRPLMARVREANTPMSVRVLIIHGRMEEDEGPDLVDIQCEALGVLGSSLLSMGAGLEITGPDGQGAVAGDEEELAEAIMATSTAGSLAGWARPDGKGILVAVGELPEGALKALGTMPAVFIGRDRSTAIDRRAVDFTGSEGLEGIVSEALSA